MSFWTDLRDTITGPFRAIGGFFGDIFAGKNVFKSLGERMAELGTAIFAPVGHILRIDPIEDFLRKLGPIGTGLANAADFSIETNRGKTPTWSAFRDNFLIPSVGVGAGVIGFGLASGASIATAEGIGLGGTIAGDALATGIASTAAFGSANAATKNPLEGLAYIASNTDVDLGIEVPSEVKDIFEGAKDIYNQIPKPAQKPAPSKPIAIGGGSGVTQSGNTEESINFASSKLPLIFAASVIGFIALDSL